MYFTTRKTLFYETCFLSIFVLTTTLVLSCILYVMVLYGFEEKYLPLSFTLYRNTMLPQIITVE